MSRTRRKDDDGGVSDGLDLRLPSRGSDGKPNPEYYRALLGEANREFVARMKRGEPMPHYQSWLNGITAEIKMSGLDPKTVMDIRTDAQIIEDAIKKIVEVPDSVWELTDREMGLLDGFFEDAAEQGREALEKLADQASDEGRHAALPREEVARIREVGKSWTSRLLKIRRLREMVRNPTWTPKDRKDHNTFRRLGEEATQTLRFMLYVGRTSTRDMGAGGTSLYRIAPKRKKFGAEDIGHHVWLAVENWIGRNGVYVYSCGAQRNVYPYKMSINVLPPGQGKTDCMLHFIGLALCKDPTLRVGIIHAKADEADKRLGMLSRMFDDDNASSKRLRALFPDVPRLRKKATASAFDFDLSLSRKSVTAMSAGVREKQSGSDLDLVYFDDIVDQDDVNQETARDTTYFQVTDKWMKRLRGNMGFAIVTATLWHEDDAINRLIGLSKKLWIRAYIDGCGGPDQNFDPVWPEMFSRAHYKQEFVGLFGDIRRYMIIYGCNPTHESAGMIRKLSFYAVTDPSGRPLPSHEEFLSGCQRMLSVDPAATKNRTSDSSGIIYAGLGFVERRTNDGAFLHPRLRLLAAMKVRALPNEVMAYIGEFTQREPVHRIYVETGSQQTFFAQQLAMRYGSRDASLGGPPGIVYPCKPVAGTATLVGKGERLKYAQPLIDHELADRGIHAVVEWPGVWVSESRACANHPDAESYIDNGRAHCRVCDVAFNRLVIDPRFKWLADQVLKFGAHAEDDGLDALTQIVNALRNELGIGGGVAVVEPMRRAADADPFMVTVIDSIRSSRVPPVLSPWAESALVLGGN